MREKVGFAVAISLIAVLFMPLLGYATGYPYDVPPSPLSVEGSVFNSDGSPVGRGIAVYVINTANGEFEETETGKGFPPLPQYDNRFSASLSYDPAEEQTIKVIAVFGSSYAEKDIRATSPSLETELTMSFDPASSFNAVPKVMEIHKSARQELGEPITPKAEKHYFVSYGLIILVIILILFFILKPSKGAKKLKMLMILLLATGLLVTFTSPVYAAEQQPVSVFSIFADIINSIFQPTAMAGKDVTAAAPPPPVTVRGYVFHSNGTAVEAGISVNAQIRYGANQTVHNEENVSTGSGPWPNNFYDTSMTGVQNVDTANVTAWNATHQGKNSSLLTSDTMELNITLTELLPDTTPPTWSNNASSIVTTYSPVTTSQFNVTWTDGTEISVGLWESNITGTPQNYTMSNISSVYYYNTIVPAGTFYWKSYANDTSGNENVTDTWYFTVAKAYNPVTMYLNNGTEYVNQNITVNYGTQTNVTGTSAGGTVNLYREGAVKASGTSPQWEITVLPGKPEGWEYKVNATGNQNYTDNSSLTYYVHVNKVPSSVSVTFSPSSSETYGTTTTAFCNITTGDQTATLTLERNGTTVASGSGNQSETKLLGGGVWNYTCAYSESQNYTASSSVNNYLTITRADNPVNLYLNGTLNSNRTITYPSASNATATSAGGTVNLYRDEVLKASGASPQSEIAQLAAAEYAYKVNATGNQNYSDNSSVTHYLIINRATPTATLNLAPSSPVTYGTSTTATCTENNPEAGGNLFRNDTNRNAENNSAVTLGVGTYYYVCNVTQTENYTSASDSDFYTVTKASPVGNLHIAVNGSESNTEVQYPSGTNTTAWSDLTDNQDLTFNLYRNGVSVGSGDPATDLLILGGGYYTYVYNTSGGANYTAASVTRLLNVTKAPNPVNLYLDGNLNQNSTITYGTTTNATGTISVGTVYLFRDEASVASGALKASEIILLGAGTYAYKVNGTGNQNYSDNTSLTFYEIVNPADPSSLMHIEVNGSETNQEFLYGNVTNTTGWTNITNQASITFNLYFNGGSVGSGTTVQDIKLLPVGNHTYIYNTTGNQNYTTGSQTRLLNITKATPTITFTISPSQTVTYPTQTTTTCSAQSINNEVTADLFRNDSDVPEPETITLGAEAYEYICNSTATQNYTATTGTKTLTVNQNTSTPSFLHLSSNGTIDSNRTYTYEEVSNVTSYTDFAEGSITLYRDGVIVGTGLSPQEIETLGVGTYNYTAYFPDNMNYSSASITFYIIVNAKSINLYLALNGTQGNLTGGYGITLNATAWRDSTLYNEGTQLLFENSTNVGALTKVFQPAARDYEYKTNFSATNYSAADVIYYASVSKVDPSGNLHIAINGTESNKVLEYPNATNVTAWSTLIDNQDLMYNLYRNDASVGSGDPVSDVALLSFGNYTYIYNTSGGTNYTAGSTTRLLNITDVKPPNITNITTNPTLPFVNDGTAQNITVDFDSDEYPINITFNLYNSTGDLIDTQTILQINSSADLPVNYTLPAGLADDIYTLNMTATDSASNSNTLNLGNIIVDTTEPQYSGEATDPTSPVTYSAGASYQFNITWTDALTNVSDIVFEFNGANYSYLEGNIQKDGNVYYITLTDLAANPSGYSYKWYANDSADNWNNTGTLSYVINKAASSVSLVTNCTWAGTTYGAFCNVTGSTITGDSITSQTLERNGTTKATGAVATEIERLGVGTWNYTYNYPGSENYTQTSTANNLVITQATPTVSEVTNSPVTYPGTTSANCTYTTINNEGSVVHTRNGTTVGSTYSEVIGGGVWNFTCYFASTQNYTSGTDAVMHTVNPGAVGLTLLLNGTDNDYTYGLNDPANFTIITSPSGLYVELWTNFSDGNNKMWDNGTSTLENITMMSTLGKFNFTGVFFGNENYTANQSTHFAEVQDITPPQAIIYDLNVSSIMRGEPWLLYANWDESISYSLTEYNVTALLQNYTTETISGTWTNHSGTTNNTWNLGVHFFKFYANDSYDNWNGTLPYKTFTLQGWSNSTAYLNATTVMARFSVEIGCLVRDTNTSATISDYYVQVYNNTDLLSSGATDANGWFNYTWNPWAVGNDTIKCAIHDNATQYYVAAYNGTENLTVTTYYPSSAGNISADIYNETTGSIILNWTLSVSDNVAGYVIYRTTNYTEGFNFTEPYYITDNVTDFWIDYNASDEDEVYYIVRTNDSITGVDDGNNITLAKYNLKLYTGWNLFSIPIDLFNWTADDIFYNAEDKGAPGRRDEIWRYFPNDTLDPYDKATFYTGFGWWGDAGWLGTPPAYLESERGYWYYSVKEGYKTTPFNVTLTGIVYTTNRTFEMYNSWNIIGLSSVEQKNIDALFPNEADRDQTWRFDTNDTLDPYKKTTYYVGFGWFGDFDFLEPGRGYWYKSMNVTTYNWTYAP